MEFITGKQYNFNGYNGFEILTYIDRVPKYKMHCDVCHGMKLNTYEFCENYNDYKNGFAPEWIHFGTECIKKIRIEEVKS